MNHCERFLRMKALTMSLLSCQVSLELSMAVICFSGLNRSGDISSDDLYLETKLFYKVILIRGQHSTSYVS